MEMTVLWWALLQMRPLRQHHRGRQRLLDTRIPGEGLFGPNKPPWCMHARTNDTSRDPPPRGGVGQLPAPDGTLPVPLTLIPESLVPRRLLAYTSHCNDRFMNTYPVQGSHIFPLSKRRSCSRSRVRDDWGTCTKDGLCTPIEINTHDFPHSTASRQTLPWSRPLTCSQMTYRAALHWEAGC